MLLDNVAPMVTPCSPFDTMSCNRTTCFICPATDHCNLFPSIVSRTPTEMPNPGEYLWHSTPTCTLQNELSHMPRNTPCHYQPRVPVEHVHKLQVLDVEKNDVAERDPHRYKNQTYTRAECRFTKSRQSQSVQSNSKTSFPGQQHPSTYMHFSEPRSSTLYSNSPAMLEDLTANLPGTNQRG